ncbi:MAG: type II toxin-antitoxin system VapC family toxin [Candidatus Magasanikbacteria bacterium]|nr:type II toxin-antitoxin system VapC family toxin [Candidatus Magasanikbacteria bacterium]
MKIFLDANILVAAAGSESGGSRYLWRVAEKDARWQLVTSAYAIAEARINVATKLPAKREEFSALITSPLLTVVHPPSTGLIQHAHNLMPLKDAPILAAALFCSAEALCTLDRKDFHTPKVKQQCQLWGLKIVLPKDLLEDWRAKQG